MFRFRQCNCFAGEFIGSFWVRSNNFLLDRVIIILSQQVCRLITHEDGNTKRGTNLSLARSTCIRLSVLCATLFHIILSYTSLFLTRDLIFYQIGSYTPEYDLRAVNWMCSYALNHRLSRIPFKVTSAL